ncbi:MAG: hypothetical protein ACJAQ3_003417 [Planctomycetota bacterium]|jgi:hypothetical protein
MKKLVLVISLCPLWLASCASQDAGTAPSPDSAAAPGPSSALAIHHQDEGVFSAHDALIACLKAVREGSGSAGVGIQSLSSKLRPADGDGPPVVGVEMKLIFQAESQEAADLAFESARSALARLAQSGVDPVTYQDSVESFVSLSPSPGPAKNADGLAAGRRLETHEATLTAQLPTARFLHMDDKSGAYKARSSAASSVQAYLRSIAASDGVLLPVSIATRRPSTVGMQSFEIRPAMGAAEDGDASIDRARIANFMHLLEKNSKRVQITSVELKEPVGEKFAYFKTRVSAPR